MRYLKVYLTYILFSIVITGEISNGSLGNIIIISLIGLPITYLFVKFNIPQKAKYLLKM